LAGGHALDYNRGTRAAFRDAPLRALACRGPHAPTHFPRAPDSGPPIVPILLVLAAIVVALIVGYAIGRARRSGVPMPAPFPRELPPETAAPSPEALPGPPVSAPPAAADAMAQDAASPSPPAKQPIVDGTITERARIVRSGEAETAALRRSLAARDASIAQLAELADERARLFADLAAAHAETARYRQFVVDLENNAPPPLFGTGAPDDLKLIVGVGPVLERMLHQLGVATYRQIAHWSERDIDEFDAKLAEFPGRIRRDAWVTQARALHQSKYGETLPVRGR
jgi:predicted flap endonuclease-1-like 5' DNA nuclease